MSKKLCPRCKTNYYDTAKPVTFPALSRRDNKTYICPECGEKETLIDAGIVSEDKQEIEFKAAIAKVKKK